MNSATAGDVHIDAIGGLGNKVAFVGNSTAASATITISGVGFLLEFGDSATAGSATIDIGAGSGLTFDDTSSGGSARVILGGDMLIDHVWGSVEIGSLEGDGQVHAVFGSNRLVVGSLNTDTTFSGILGGLDDPGEGAFGLTKTGTGTLTLTGYAGAKYTLDTTVSGGTLRAGGGHVFSTASAYDVATGGTLDLNGHDQAIGGLKGFDNTGTVKLGAATLTVGDGSSNFAGTISGTGSLVVDAAGSGLVLYGTNTYTGDTIIKAGALHFHGGSAIADASTLKVNDGGATTGVVVFDAEAIGALADGTDGGGQILLGGSLTVGANNSSTSFSGTISTPSLPAGLIKIGTGTQTLSGDSTYTGATTINGGVLRIDGSITSAAIVNSGGTLGGNGAVAGNVLVNSGGHLGPGASAGSLEIGGLFLKAGSTLDIEIAGTTPGTQYDQLVVDGTVTLGGTLKGRLLGGANPATGTSFTIIDNVGGDDINGTLRD
jgi:autotransporter-associated beta strand protein